MLFHYFISKIRFGFAKHTYSLIFTLKIGWKHAWTAKLYRFRGLFYALNCRKCYCIEADSNMPSYHVFFAIFTSFVSFWTYPSLTNRHSPTPCPHCTTAQPTLATWRQLNVELLHSFGGNCHLPPSCLGFRNPTIFDLNMGILEKCENIVPQLSAKFAMIVLKNDNCPLVRLV